MSDVHPLVVVDPRPHLSAVGSTPPTKEDYAHLKTERIKKRNKKMRKPPVGSPSRLGGRPSSFLSSGRGLNSSYEAKLPRRSSHGTGRGRTPMWQTSSSGQASGGRGVGGAISARSSSRPFPSMSPSKKEQGAPATTTAGPPQVRSSFGQSKSSPQSALKDMGMGGMVCSPLSAAETMARTNVSRNIPPPAFGHVGGGRSSSGDGGSSSSGVVLGMPPPQSTTIQQHESSRSPSCSLSSSRHSTLS